DLGLAIFAALGGDEHHTVGSARAVDGGCRGIFQYLNVLNVIGVDVVERVASAVAAAAVGRGLVERKAVNHVQRLAARRNGARAPHPHRKGAARNTRRLLHLHAGQLAYQRLVNAAYYYHVVEAFGILAQLHIDSAGPSKVALLRGVAHKAEYQGTALFGHAQREGAIGPGAGALGRAFQHYRHARQGLAFIGGDAAGQLPVVDSSRPILSYPQHEARGRARRPALRCAKQVLGPAFAQQQLRPLEAAVALEALGRGWLHHTVVAQGQKGYFGKSPRPAIFRVEVEAYFLAVHAHVAGQQVELVVLPPHKGILKLRVVPLPRKVDYGVGGVL
nr:hypothetical protein [Tanacetum cinerariifolium]